VQHSIARMYEWPIGCGMSWAQEDLHSDRSRACLTCFASLLTRLIVALHGFDSLVSLGSAVAIIIPVVAFAGRWTLRRTRNSHNDHQVRDYEGVLA